MGTTAQSVGGGITLSSSTLTSPKSLSHRPSGDISLSKNLTKSITYVTHRYVNSPGGELRIEGSVACLKHFHDTYAGDITLSKSLGMVILKTPIPKTLSGSVHIAKSLTSSKTFPETPSSTITLSSTLAKRIEKALAGGIGTEGDATSGFPQDISGVIILAGDGVYEVGKPLSGSLILTSSLDTGGRLGVEGRITLSSDLARRLTLLRTHTGSISISGDPDPINPTHMLSIGGEVRVARVLTTGVTLYTGNDVSLMNLASSYDLVIEKGTTFYRKFRWLKKDGIPFDLNNMTLRMDIKPYKDSPSFVISSAGTDAGITLAKVTSEPGVFTITIAKTVTSSLDFTRGVYAINVAFRTGMTVRLVEGEVVLSKAGAEVVTTYTEDGEGYIAISGVLTPQRGRVIAREVGISGILTTIENFVRAPAGGITLSSTLLKRVSITKGGTVDMSATPGTALPTHFDGGITLAGEVTTIKSYVRTMTGTIEAAG